MKKQVHCIREAIFIYKRGLGPFIKPMFTVSDSGSSRYALVLQCPFPFFFLVSNSFRIQDDSCIMRAKTQRPREAIPLLSTLLKNSPEFLNLSVSFIRSVFNYYSGSNNCLVPSKHAWRGQFILYQFVVHERKKPCKSEGYKITSVIKEA